MRKDIQAINEALSKVHKEQSDNTDMAAAPTSRADKLKQYEDIFYHTWENIVDGLSDEQLSATMHMISHYDELNKLIKDQSRYRNNQVARNRAQQYALDRE